MYFLRDILSEFGAWDLEFLKFVVICNLS